MAPRLKFNSWMPVELQLAYMNFYWTGLTQDSGGQARLTVTVGVGNLRECKFQSDATFYIDGRLTTGLGGVGLGPEGAPMLYQTYRREFFIPPTARITVRPGIGANLAMNRC